MVECAGSRSLAIAHWAFSLVAVALLASPSMTAGGRPSSVEAVGNLGCGEGALNLTRRAFRLPLLNVTDFQSCVANVDFHLLRGGSVTLMLKVLLDVPAVNGVPGSNDLVSLSTCSATARMDNNHRDDSGHGVASKLVNEVEKMLVSRPNPDKVGQLLVEFNRMISVSPNAALQQIRALQATFRGLLMKVDGRMWPASVAGLALLLRMSGVLADLESNVKNINAELQVQQGKYFDPDDLLAGFRFLLCRGVFKDNFLPQQPKPCALHCYNLLQMLNISKRIAYKMTKDALAANQSHQVASLAQLQYDPLADAINTLSHSCSSDPYEYCQLNELDMSFNNISALPGNSTPSELPQICTPEKHQFCLNLKCPSPILKPTEFSDRWNDDSKNLSAEVYKVLHTAFPYFRNISLNEKTGMILPCGVSCSAIIFSDADADQSRLVVKVFAWLVFFFTLFAVISFVLNREKLNKFPTRILFYINFCYFIGNFSFLFQQFDDYERYVCNADGTLRMREPRNSTLCSLLFSLMYFFYISALFWWLALTQSWYITFESFNQNTWRFYFSHLEVGYHIIIWTLSGILLGVMLGQSYVDGVPLYGVCFTSREEPWFNMMAIPVVISGVLGLPFLVLGSLKVWHFRASMIGLTRRSSTISNRRRIENQESLRIFLIRLSFIIISSFGHLLLQAAVAIYRRVSFSGWQASARRQAICLMTSCCKEQCDELAPSPSLPMFILLIVFVEMQGVILTLWIFNKQTWQKWKDVSRGSIKLVRRLSSREVIPMSSRSSIDSTLSDSGVTRRHTQLNARRMTRMSSVEFNLRYNVDDSEKAWQWSQNSEDVLSEEEAADSPKVKKPERLPSTLEIPDDVSVGPTESTHSKREQFAKRGSRVTFSESGVSIPMRVRSESDVTPRSRFSSLTDIITGHFSHRTSVSSTASEKMPAAHHIGTLLEEYRSSPGVHPHGAMKRPAKLTSPTASFDAVFPTPPSTPSSILKKSSASEAPPPMLSTEPAQSTRTRSEKDNGELRPAINNSEHVRPVSAKHAAKEKMIRRQKQVEDKDDQQRTFVDSTDALSQATFQSTTSSSLLIESSV